MKTEKKIMPKIHLCDHKGDLSRRWFIYWREDGHRTKKYKGINTHHTIEDRKKAAQDLIKEWEEKLDTNTKGFRGTKYAKQYKLIEKFIQSKQASWRPATKKQVDSRMRIFLKWNKRRIINTERIEEFIHYLSTTGRKQNTLHGYYLILRNILGNTLGEELFEGISVKKVDGTPARYFSKGQIKFLSTQISQLDPELWLAVRFIFYCFIRPGELRQLKVGDVILEEEKICIPAEVSKNRKTQYVVIPKVFLEELEPILIQRNPSAFLIGGNFDAVSKKWMSTRHQQILRDLHFDVNTYKLYSWKHTGAVIACKSGVNLKQLQLQLRHHSLDQVNAYLRQLGIFDMGEFADKMPRI